MKTIETKTAWEEYDAAAEYMAKRNRKGEVGELLPPNMTPEAVNLINADPESFQERVRLTAYAISMSACRDIATV